MPDGPTFCVFSCFFPSSFNGIWQKDVCPSHMPQNNSWGHHVLISGKNTACLLKLRLLMTWLEGVSHLVGVDFNHCLLWLRARSQVPRGKTERWDLAKVNEIWISHKIKQKKWKRRLLYKFTSFYQFSVLLRIFYILSQLFNINTWSWCSSLQRNNDLPTKKTLSNTSDHC